MLAKCCADVPGRRLIADKKREVKTTKNGSKQLLNYYNISPYVCSRLVRPPTPPPARGVHIFLPSHQRTVDYAAVTLSLSLSLTWVRSQVCKVSRTPNRGWENVWILHIQVGWVVGSRHHSLCFCSRSNKKHAKHVSRVMIQFCPLLHFY